jgi:hypothetical protein
MNVRALFEDELRQRGFPFSIDPESGRHAVEIGGARMLVGLENLQRDVVSDGDSGHISRFVDAIIASSDLPEREMSTERLYWCLESNDYKERGDFCVAISDRVDRVLVHLSSDGRLITWVTPAMLKSLGMSESDAGSKAFANLASALSKATVESQDIDGVQLGFIGTSLPFKTSLILAPNFREVVGAVLGWPLMAVIPDRNFLYLWAARHTDFVQRVGRVVVREYSQAPYPISTEVYEIADQKIRAIGEFPRSA